MKKLILVVTATIFSSFLMAQNAASVSKPVNGIAVNQRGDIKEVSPIGSKSEVRGGKGIYKNMNEMRERRHHKHHRRHHGHHHQNNNQAKQHPVHNRVHR
jgi:ABC-type Zn2+ transport system substrate-binding protein/surface adhesin